MMITMRTDSQKSIRTRRKNRQKNAFPNGSFLNFKTLLLSLNHPNNGKQKTSKTRGLPRVWMNGPVFLL